MFVKTRRLCMCLCVFPHLKLTKTLFCILFNPYSSSQKLFFFFCILLIVTVFFPLPCSPFLLPFPLQSPHCCPCPWVLFPLCSIPPPTNLPRTLTSCHLLSIYESVPIFLDSPVCSSGSTYERNHMVFVFALTGLFH